MMTEKKAELDLRAALLDLIEKHRRDSGKSDLGTDLEHFITDRELSDLGDGVAEHELVLLRRKNHHRQASN